MILTEEQKNGLNNLISNYPIEAWETCTRQAAVSSLEGMGCVLPEEPQRWLDTGAPELKASTAMFAAKASMCAALEALKATDDETRRKANDRRIAFTLLFVATSDRDTIISSLEKLNLSADFSTPTE